MFVAAYEARYISPLVGHIWLAQFQWCFLSIYTFLCQFKVNSLNIIKWCGTTWISAYNSCVYVFRQFPSHFDWDKHCFLFKYIQPNWWLLWVLLYLTCLVIFYASHVMGISEHKMYFESFWLGHLLHIANIDCGHIKEHKLSGKSPSCFWQMQNTMPNLLVFPKLFMQTDHLHFQKPSSAQTMKWDKLWHWERSSIAYVLVSLKDI